MKEGKIVAVHSESGWSHRVGVSGVTAIEVGEVAGTAGMYKTYLVYRWDDVYRKGILYLEIPAHLVIAEYGEVHG